MAVINLKEAAPDSPHRCHGPGNGAEGQCRYLSYTGLQEAGLLSEITEEEAAQPYCPKHGTQKVKKEVRRQYHDYLKGQWATQITEFAASQEVKSLRGEIGLIRMLIQTILDSSESRTDLIANSSRLVSMITQAEKLVVSCDKLEYRMGELIDQETALDFAANIVEIIKSYVADPLQLDEISTKIAVALRKAMEQRLDTKDNT